jgi:3-(3-hydroxy-phenyl)propionate hydroxylase
MGTAVARGDDTEVVVVGGGPVGLMAAYRLHEFGISCVVIEREEALPTDLRASTFHPPTLDMLEEYGLDSPLLEEGLIAPSWQIRLHGSRERAVFDLSLLEGDTRHPYRLQCEQYHLTRALVERLRGSPVADLRFGARVTEASQTDEGVVVNGLSADGNEFRVTARFLIGADGAHSVVRKVFGFPFEGHTYPETTILVTTTFPFQDHLPDLSHVNYCWSDHGTFTLHRLKNLWRGSQYPDAGETLEEAQTPPSIQRKFQRIVPTGEPYPVDQMRAYRVHMRIVDDYRRGRVLLAGDAAHLNSPAGGMGMNGGIHDAFALTALIRQVSAGAPESVLDDYSRRRRPVAEAEILGQADRNRRRMQERDPVKRREILSELQALVADRERARDYLLKTSMIAGLRQAGGLG